MAALGLGFGVDMRLGSSGESRGMSMGNGTRGMRVGASARRGVCCLCVVGAAVSVFQRG